MDLNSSKRSKWSAGTGLWFFRLLSAPSRGKVFMADRGNDPKPSNS
jgi:hypothetical protein